MAFEVNGSLAGVAYAAVVGDDGQVTGSGRLLTALKAAAGSTVKVTPTGPTYTVKAGDPVSTWAWLARRTDIVETSGDLPQLVPPAVVGAVY